MGGSVRVAAVDLGASSGRVVTAEVGAGRLDLGGVTRFPNTPVRVGPTLHWDVLALYRDVLDGLRAAGPLDSVGIDSWAVDYGLLDADGQMVGNPVHYRDARTEGMIERVLAQVPAAELYGQSGLQLLPFNTLFQLTAARGTAQFAAVRTLLLIPDLLGYWLTGNIGAERTNASTTQLLDIRTGHWNTGLAELLGLPVDLLPPLREPGSRIGLLRPELGLGGVPVTAVASHDTASAVVAVPAEGRRFAYISCGTWSLAGVELDRPVLTADSLAADFTNETGIDGTVRYLRNIMGLWLLQESQRVWGIDDVQSLLRQAAEAPAFRSIVDVNDPVLLPPGDIPARIRDLCAATGQPVPADPAAVTRCILDSLALAHRQTLEQAAVLAGHAIDVVHLVGGGAGNELLCQLTADACGRPVLAGPVEATAIGNLLVQARSLGAVGETLDEMRSLVRSTQPLRRYEPRGDDARWREAAERLVARGSVVPRR